MAHEMKTQHEPLRLTPTAFRKLGGTSKQANRHAIHFCNKPLAACAVEIDPENPVLPKKLHGDLGWDIVQTGFKTIEEFLKELLISWYGKKAKGPCFFHVWKEFLPGQPEYKPVARRKVTTSGVMLTKENITALTKDAKAGSWLHVEGLKEDWVHEEETWEMSVGGYARVMGGRKMTVLLCRRGKYHVNWCLFIDGTYDHTLDLVTFMGSGWNAMRMVEHKFNARFADIKGSKDDAP